MVLYMLCNSCEKLNYKVIEKPCLNCGKVTSIYNIGSLCEPCSKQLLKCACCLKILRSFKTDKNYCKSCGKNI